MPRQAFLQRAKPLLGTLVIVRVRGLRERELLQASDAAFARVAAIHAAMSFHDEGSDLRRLARARAGEVVRVCGDTAQVLREALRMERDSGAAFNACCAPRLVERGVLPAPRDATSPQAHSLEEAIEMLADDRVQVKRPTWIDLGGIAKGHAVDAAVAELELAGARQGQVNAGGDLRVFGTQHEAIHLRDPRRPWASWLVAQLTEGACATTATAAASGSAAPAHLVAPAADDKASASHAAISVSVFAATCTVADALTKVVWWQGESATPLLRAREARALVLRRDGSALQM